MSYVTSIIIGASVFASFSVIASMILFGALVCLRRKVSDGTKLFIKFVIYIVKVCQKIKNQRELLHVMPDRQLLSTMCLWTNGFLCLYSTTLINRDNQSKVVSDKK